MEIHPEVTAFMNTSYQRLSGELDFQVSTTGRPRYKLNGGVNIRAGGLFVRVLAHWLDKTFWFNASLTALRRQELEVPGYGLLNAHASYGFTGTLKGLEAAVDAFNLTDNKHFKIIEARGSIDLGQSGEQIRRRVTATLSYRF